MTTTPLPTVDLSPATPATPATTAEFANRPASRVALAFLDAMQRRDLAAARTFLAPDFSMCFPGGHRMHQLEELVLRSGQRYRQVAKRFEQVDEAAIDEGIAVYCSGTLYGTWTDGQVFDGIRFIDRFEVVSGRIRRQDVWNDIAELAGRRMR